MLVMDGFEVVWWIKQQVGEELVLIIFFIFFSEIEVLVQSLEVGGDDFFFKLYNWVIFEVKINVMGCLYLL